MKKATFGNVKTRITIRQAVALAVLVSWCTTVFVGLTGTLSDASRTENPTRRGLLGALSSTKSKPLVFYNKPPKTGSTTIRIAMQKAAEAAGLVPARCFARPEWNEMALRTLINRDKVDFYGCHTRLTNERFNNIVSMRGGNVVFMTNTRDAKNIILSAFLQLHRKRDVAEITDPLQMREEIERYKDFVDDYPVNALYKFHGGRVPLISCPYQYKHEFEMRRLAERYEVVVDLSRPKESAELVKEVTGLKPNFNMWYNRRTENVTSPMVAELAKIDTSRKMCGNELVHKVLMQQYNIIKDRLMRNRCFDEATGTYALCETVAYRQSGRKNAYYSRST